MAELAGLRSPAKCGSEEEEEEEVVFEKDGNVKKESLSRTEEVSVPLPVCSAGIGRGLVY